MDIRRYSSPASNITHLRSVSGPEGILPQTKQPKLDIRIKPQEDSEAITAIPIPRVKSIRDVEEISFTINKHFIFASLPIHSRIKMIKEFTLCHLKAGEYVFKQGNQGRNFYIIAKGSVEVQANGKRIQVLNRRDSFGELTLIHDFPRTTSKYTLTSTYLWVLDRKSFKNSIKEASEINYEENKQFMQSFPLFSTLTNDQMLSLVEVLLEVSYRPSQKIIKEGEQGDHCYFVKEGVVKCKKDDRILREITKGGYFGEQALFSSCVRTATIISITDVRCIAISRQALEQSLGSDLQKIILENSKLIAMGRSELLNKLDNSQKLRFVEMLCAFRYNPGDVVLAAGTVIGNHIWMVLHGKLQKKRSGKIVDLFQCIGDTEVLHECQGVLDEDLVAVDMTEVAVVSKEEVMECFGKSNCGISISDWKALKQVDLLRLLSKEKFSEAVGCLKVEEFSDRNIIFKENTPGEQFFLIQSGRVDIVKEGSVLRTISMHDYFGERSLLFDDRRTATAIANGDVVCWTLRRNDFLCILHENLRKRLMKRIEMQDLVISLEELRILKLLGKGSFGSVFLVSDIHKNNFFALKFIAKSIIDEHNLHPYIELERRILSSMNNEFTLKMIKSFENSKGIYLLTEYVKGINLYEVCKKLILVSEDDSQFYIACLIYILEYLHERDIIYRDLKPENIIIEEDGYPKLVDFGSSKFLQGRTYTVLGTPYYMAPEIIIGKGYNHSVDYWSLGVLLFELVYGHVPFGVNENDPFLIYQSILTKELVFPSLVVVSPKLVSFVEQLLCKAPVLRNGGSIEKLKANPWLKDVNWDRLISREVLPPFMPDLAELNKTNTLLLENQVALDDAL